MIGAQRSAFGGSPLSTVYTTATTFTFDGTGGTSASVTLSYTKIGNWLVLNIPVWTATTGTGSISASSDTVLPVAFRPLAVQRILCASIKNNNAAVATPGLFRFGTNGGIILYRDPLTTAFTNASTCGLDSEGASFLIFLG